MNISVNLATLSNRLLFALAVSSAFLFFGAGLVESRMLTIAQTLASATGSLLGFLITAVSIVTAMMERPLLENMRKTGHFQRLMEETFAACVTLLAATVASIATLFQTGTSLESFITVAIFLSVLSLEYVIEAGRRFLNVIRAI